MIKQILIVDSSNAKHQFLAKILGQLIKHDYWFWFWGRHNNLSQQFRYNNWPSKTSQGGWIIPQWLMWLQPILWLNRLLKLWSYQQLHNIKTIVCLHWPEQLLLTPLVHWLGWRCLWLQDPSFDYTEVNHWRQRYLRSAEQADSIICLASVSRQQALQFGLPEDKCRVILPGIELSDYLYQDNIFNNLAAVSPAGHQRFTIGTVVDLQYEQRVEMLLQALQTCLSLDPDIQLVLIGAEAERKKINWLVKKMRLDNKVWVISDQASLKKWFNNFDVLVVASKRPQLEEIVTAIGAMANGIIVIGPEDAALTDLSFNNQAAWLIDMSTSEGLTSQLIALQQDPVQRKQLANNAKAVVQKYFLLERLLKDLIAVLQ